MTTPKHFMCYGTSAQLHLELGDLAAAEAALGAAWSRADYALGPADRVALRADDALAEVYERRGELAAAEAMLQRVMEGYEKWLGPEH
jgi:hypothetical protein